MRTAITLRLRLRIASAKRGKLRVDCFLGGDPALAWLVQGGDVSVLPFVELSIYCFWEETPPIWSVW